MAQLVVTGLDRATEWPFTLTAVSDSGERSPQMPSAIGGSISPTTFPDSKAGQAV